MNIDNTMAIELDDTDLTGTCKFFDPGKGWGFIAGDDGLSYFVHVTNLIDHISAGRKVVFKLGHSLNKANSLEAIEVKLASLVVNNYGYKDKCDE